MQKTEKTRFWLQNTFLCSHKGFSQSLFSLCSCFETNTILSLLRIIFKLHYRINLLDLPTPKLLSFQNSYQWMMQCTMVPKSLNRIQKCSWTKTQLWNASWLYKLKTRKALTNYSSKNSITNEIKLIIKFLWHVIENLHANIWIELNKQWLQNKWPFLKCKLFYNEMNFLKKNC